MTYAQNYLWRWLLNVNGDDYLNWDRIYKTYREIASESGISYKTVCKAMQCFKSEGLIEQWLDEYGTPFYKIV